MAGQRLTDKSALIGNLASSDLLMVVDTSDTTGSPQGTSKQVIIPYIIHTQQVQLTEANMNGLFNNPFLLIPPTPAGHFANVLNVSVQFRNTVAQNSNIVEWFFMYSLAPPPSVTPPAFFGQMRRPYFNTTNPVFHQINSFYVLTGMAQAGDPEGLGFWLMGTANMNLTGTTCDIYVTYILQKA